MTRITDPTAYADQEQAAHAELGGVLAGIATAGATLTGHADVTMREAAPWLAWRIAQLRDAVANGTATACPHLTTPRPIVHALWNPSRVTCPDCAPTLCPDPFEDTVCDRCRTPATLIYPRAAARGLFLFLFGLCEPCRRTEEDPAAEHHQASHGRAQARTNRRAGQRRQSKRNR